MDNILYNSGCKPNRIWENESSEFYNRSMKLWLEKNGTEIYSTCNKRKLLSLKDLLKT